MSTTETEESATVAFTLTEDEFVAFGLIRSQQGEASRRRLMPILIGLWALVVAGTTVVVLAIGGWKFRVRDPFLGLVLLGLILPLVVATIGRSAKRWRLKGQFCDPRQAALRQPRHAEATADGLALGGPRFVLMPLSLQELEEELGADVAEPGLLLVPWWAFQGVRRVPLGLVIDQTPSEFCAVPRRAFASGAEFARFERIVRSYLTGPAAAPMAWRGDSITYALTLEDIVEFLYFVKQRRFARRHRRFITFTGVSVPLIAFLVAANRQNLGWPDAGDALPISAVVVFVGGIAAAFWYGEPWLDRRLSRSIARGHATNRAFAPAQAEIAPDGFHVVRPDAREQVPWRSIITVETGPAALYLFTTPAQAHIIPRRAFESDDYFNGFVAAVRQYRRVIP